MLPSLTVNHPRSDSSGTSGGQPSPHFLLRRAGLPLWALHLLRCERTVQLCEEGARLREECEQLGPPLCDALAACLTAAPPRERRVLLALKRDVFNGRPPRAAGALEVAARYLAPGALESLRKWQACWSAERERLEAGARAFEQEQAVGRRRLRELLVEPSFQKALQLSGPELVRSLRAYCAHPSERPLSKALRHGEQTLVAYLARMATKPTPYGHFTTVLPGRWEPGGTVMRAEGVSGPQLRLVRLSRQALKDWEAGLAADPETARGLRPRVNTTCQQVGEHLRFFVRGQEGSGEGPGRETFVSVEAHPAVRYVLGHISQQPAPSLGELTAELARMAGWSPGGAERFLAELRHMGLLELDFGIPDQTHDYPRALCERLESLASDKARRARELLGRLAELERDFGTQEVEGRQRSLDELEALGAKLGELLGRTPPLWRTARPLLSEDVGVWPEHLALDPRAWSRALRGLGLLQRLLPLFDPGVAEQMMLCELFRDVSGPGGRVEFLEFYRHVRKRPREALEVTWQRLMDPKAGAGLMREVRAARERLWEQLGSALTSCPEAGEVVLSEAWLEDFLEGLPPCVIPWESAAHYCQVLEEDGEGQARVVWNRSGLGFGKHFSRHAPLFEREGDNPLVRSLRSAHEAWTGTHTCADLLGVLGANMNLHPWLLPYEVVYPGCVSERQGEAVLGLGDLEVEEEPGRQRLELYSKRLGKRLTLIPQGFLYPLAAPPLYGFLSLFAATRGSQVSLWAHYDTWHGRPASGQVRRYPRLLLGTVVIDRATWKIPTTHLPRCAPGQNGFEVFARVQRWRRELGLPREGFIRVRNWMEGAADEAGTWWDRAKWLEQARRTRARKPMYVDFDNPFLVSLMWKYLADAEEEFTFQELLPSGAELERLPTSGHVTELLLEVNLPRHGAARDQP